MQYVLEEEENIATQAIKLMYKRRYNVSTNVMYLFLKIKAKIVFFRLFYFTFLLPYP